MTARTTASSSPSLLTAKPFRRDLGQRRYLLCGTNNCPPRNVVYSPITGAKLRPRLLPPTPSYLSISPSTKKNRRHSTKRTSYFEYRCASSDEESSSSDDSNSFDDDYSILEYPVQPTPTTTATTKKKRRLRFSSRVQIYEIPSRHSYSAEEKECIWTTRKQLRRQLRESAKDYAYEGLDWKTAIEESGFVRNDHGELVHPAHVALEPLSKRQRTE